MTTAILRRRMMKAWVNLLLMVSVLLLCACEAVVTGQPMGAEIVKLDTAT